jgi:hypothetical protein
MTDMNLNPFSGMNPAQQRAALITLLSLGGGVAGGSALASAPHLWRKLLGDKAIPSQSHHVVENIEYPEAPESSPVKPRRNPFSKEGSSPAFGTLADWTGRKATSALDVPWMPTAATAAGLGGGLLSHKLVSSWLERKRKEELEKQYQDAEKDYEEALAKQFDPSKLRHLSPKAASSPTTCLDYCFNMLEKAGMIPQPYGPTPTVNLPTHQDVGFTAMISALLAAGGAYGGYKWMKGRSDASALAKAMKDREIARQQRNPADVTFDLEPAHKHPEAAK